MANKPRTPGKAPAKPLPAKGKAAPTTAPKTTTTPKQVALTGAPAVSPALPQMIELGASEAVSPPTVDSKATKLEPLAQAGVWLTVTVLGLITVSIIILTSILAFSESRAADQSARTSEQALTIAAAARTGAPDVRLALLAVELRRAQSDPAWTLPQASADEAAAVVKALGADAALTPAQRALIVTCVPLPAAAAPKRAETLAGCAELVEQVAAARESPAERLKFLADLQKQADDQHQAFRTFWLQVAQLILMNLFFPLLTALLGYIFGTRQAAKPD